MWQASPWSRGGWVLSVDSHLSRSSELELEWENSLISLEVNAPSAQGPGNFCLDPPPEGAVYGLGKGNRTQMLFMLGINTFPPYLFLPSEDRHAPGLGHWFDFLFQ